MILFLCISNYSILLDTYSGRPLLLSDLDSEAKFSVDEDLGVAPPGVDDSDWFGDLCALSVLLWVPLPLAPEVDSSSGL